MIDMNHLFKVGQQVVYYDNSFDAVNRKTPCVVKEILSPTMMVLTDIQTNTDLYIEEDFGLDRVYPIYNF